MKKTEDYIKPQVLDSIIPNPEEVEKVKAKYAELSESGELEKIL